MKDGKSKTNWVLVTGASQGIGAAAARRLAADGFGVVAAARNRDRIEALAAELEGAGYDAWGLQCDVTDRESLERMAEELRARGIRLAALVNNAATLGPIGPLMETDENEWMATVDVNLFGVFRCLRVFAPLFEEGRIAVVNVSSGASQRAMEGWSAYCASKAALAMLTKSLALEFADRCLVYGFQPGIVDTDMQGRIRASGINPVSQIPREQLLPVEEPAAIISWLCLERPEDLHGTEFRADDSAIRGRIGLK